MLTLGFCHQPVPVDRASSCAASAPAERQVNRGASSPVWRVYGDDAALRGVGWIPGVNLSGRALGEADPVISKHQKYALMFSGISTLAIVANSLFNILRSTRSAK